MDLDTITVDDFKELFRRAFPYLPSNYTLVSDDADNYVLDEDIEKAFSEAKIVFNQALWGNEEAIKIGYLYLSAFFLVNDMRSDLGGISGQSFMPVSSRSVGNVSESYHIPQAYLEDPLLAMYTANPWGMKYLQLVMPMLRGNVVAVMGATRP
jgi:hypothetical protein